jgi:hypothetical protein
MPFPTGALRRPHLCKLDTLQTVSAVSLFFNRHQL